MAALRTNSGCWTCRIRRKKCDDVQPFCGPCTFRQITCHGYGAKKPTWMDSAESQKAEIERIKQAVKQNFKSRRAFRVSKKSAAQSTNETPLGATSKSRPKQGVSIQDEESHGKLCISRTESGSAILPLVDPWPQVRDTSESFISAVDTAPLQIVHLEGMQTVYPYSFHPAAPPAENEHDLRLIMNYLDNVFPLQFYFYQPSNTDRDRGWLLSLLLRARSSYYCALTFSVLTQLIFVHNGNTIKEQELSADLDRYHTLALSELQKQLDHLPLVSGYEHLKLGVEILACMVQLLSIEVFRETKEYIGWNEDWEVHLQAAGSLLSVIGTHLPTSSDSPTSASSGDEDAPLQASDREKTAILLPLNEIAALDFFMTAYIWGDVVSCASIGSSNANNGSWHYLTYLEEGRIRLERLMGCRNWAMIAIKEIANLEAWRNVVRNARSLSIPELSRRAAAIENRLETSLQHVLDSQDTLSKYDQECNLVTQIYALSALTYLGIVVSGNSYLVAEIQSSVRKTMKMLKALPPHLLMRVSWPYCVAGCMSTEEQKDDFRNIVFDTHEAGHPLGTLRNSLELMEEFWILQENQTFMQMAQNSDKCPWALAMRSLGIKILII